MYLFFKNTNIRRFDLDCLIQNFMEMTLHAFADTACVKYPFLQQPSNHVNSYRDDISFVLSTCPETDLSRQLLMTTFLLWA